MEASSIFVWIPLRQQVSEDGGAADNLIEENTFAMFLGEDKATTPEVGLYLDWLHKTHPNTAPDLFSMFSWTDAALFVQALKAAGPSPTRAGLLTALGSIHNFDDSGMLAPADVGSKKPPICYVIVKYQANKYVRVDPEDKGFQCEPGGYNFG
jgi:hypothetical protein